MHSIETHNKDYPLPQYRLHVEVSTIEEACFSRCE